MTVMTNTTSAIKAFIDAYDSEKLESQDLETAIKQICDSESFKGLLLALINSPAFSEELGKEFAQVNAIEGISACRSLRSCLNFNLSTFFATFCELVSAFDEAVGENWYKFANRIHPSEFAKIKLIDNLKKSEVQGQFYQELADKLVQEDPHAIFPTSCYRQSRGYVESTEDYTNIQAVLNSSTFTSVKLIDNCLDPEQTVLRDIYISLGRCVCLVDENVERFFGEQIEHYFDYHGIPLEKIVYRAMEVDKGISTVEKMLGDFKRLGVSRNEAVLIVGGGVLADTGGLACALYHRNTPYVMLSTSIVAGIDAGPSPRTCCDGFGYKNLFGAYHPPVVSITDRYFFKTLRQGWLRHGVTEMIKMAVVKDKELFELLEKGGLDIVNTSFGVVDCEPDDEVSIISQRILACSLRSYVEAEYDNLYETHQCRPHAYGHTWSPGFEIEAGLLHGHAVSIGMGFGAYLSYRLNWITKAECDRIMNLISTFGLSLWHDIFLKKETVWSAQVKIVQKRGQNLAAPLPKGEIGKCGYLNEIAKEDLFSYIDEYQEYCQAFPRNGLGIDPLCSDVGLEDPSTVGNSIAQPVEEALSTV